MREFFIFADFDGPLAHITTWQNDTKMGKELSDVRDLNLYELNYIDRICRNLSDDIVVHFISISSWSFQFNKAETIEKVKEWAGIKRLDLDLYSETIPARFSERELWKRLRTIKDFVDRRKPEDYIILDDEFLMQYESEHKGHCILADSRSGYNQEGWEKVRQRIESWGLKEEVIKNRKERDEAFSLLLGSSI